MDDALLIQQVEQFLFLYDKKHIDFKNKIKRENAWTTIGVILEQTPESCEQRWVVLRNKYNTIRRDIRNAPSGCSGELTQVKWPLFSSLNFLEPFIVSRKTRTSYTAPHSSGSSVGVNIWDSMEEVIAPCDISQNSQNSQTESQDILPIEIVRVEDAIIIESSSNSEGTSSARSNCEQRTLSTSASSRTPTGTTKRSAGGFKGSSKVPKNGDAQVASQITQTLEQFGKYLEGRTATTSTEPVQFDEDVLFGRQIASEIKKIENIQDKMKIKRDIYDIFYNYFKNKD